MRSISARFSAVVLLGLSSYARAADVPVMVLPFADGSGGQAGWAGKSIQQSLAGDVARGGGYTTVAPPAAVAASDDLAVAISAARQANVPYVVFGSYHVQGDRLRVVANAVDVEQMRFIGAVDIARDARQIFNATDALGTHVVGHLNGARGDARGAINTPGNAVGASPVSRVQMPLTSMPFSYVDWAAAARPKTQRSSQWAQMMPQQLVVDHPLEHIPNRLLAPTRDPRMPFQNQVQSGDGNQVTRSDGNAVTGGDGNTITGGDGNTIQRGDGNTLSYNRSETVPEGRGFGNTMRYNRGPAQGATNVPGAGAGNAVNGPTAGAVRPQSGRAVSPGSGSAVRPNNGNAVRPNSGNAAGPTR